MPLEHHLVLCERPRLVTAENIHGPQILHGAQLFDDNVLAVQHGRPTR